MLSRKVNFWGRRRTKKITQEKWKPTKWMHKNIYGVRIEKEKTNICEENWHSFGNWDKMMTNKHTKANARKASTRKICFITLYCESYFESDGWKNVFLFFCLTQSLFVLPSLPCAPISSPYFQSPKKHTIESMKQSDK